MVFPDAKDIEANLVGQDNLIQQIVHALESADGQTSCPGGLQSVSIDVRALSGLPRKKECGGAGAVWSGQFR